MIQVNPGEHFQHLTFIRLLPPRGAGKHRTGIWRCICGTEKEMEISRVRNGTIESCGCVGRENSRIASTKHGMRNSPEYRSWAAMKMRCLVPSNKDYPRWGGIGITVCAEWANSFEKFFEYIGPRPTGTTLDRIDGTRGYEPGNVRWATPKEQARNRKDFVEIVTPLGRMPLIDYAAKIGISEGAAHLRLKRGKLEGCTRV
jgi:hypothetical protein